MPTAKDRQNEQERADAAEEESVRSLLARANLLRMRGQWDDAITACTEALRRSPRSANAHALLGNIYESQGKNEDAIEWYIMARELRPLNAADAAQLERLLDIQRVKLRTDELSNTIPLEQKPATEKTLEWFDRIFPPGRSDGLTRLILAMSVSVAVVIAICAALIYFFVSPRREEAQADALQAGAPDTLVAASPIVMTPSLTKANAPAPASASPAASDTPAAGTAAVRSSPDAATADLRSKLALALEDGGASVSALTMAAGAGSIGMDVTMPAVKGESQEHLRERVVRVAGLAARAAALSAPESTQKALVRLGLDIAAISAGGPSGQTNGATSAHAGATVVFIGAVTLRSFRDSSIAGLPTSDLLARFDTVQWYSLLSANSTSSAGAQSVAGVSPAPSASPSPVLGAATGAAAGGTAGASSAGSGPTPAPVVPPAAPSGE